MLPQIYILTPGLFKVKKKKKKVIFWDIQLSIFWTQNN